MRRMLAELLYQAVSGKKRHHHGYHASHGYRHHGHGSPLSRMLHLLDDDHRGGSRFYGYGYGKPKKVKYKKHKPWKHDGYRYGYRPYRRRDDDWDDD